MRKPLTTSWLKKFSSKLYKYSNKVRYIFIVIAVLYTVYLVASENERVSYSHLVINVKYLVAAFLTLGLNHLLFSVVWHIIVMSIKKGYCFVDNMIAFCEAQVAKALPTPAFFIASRFAYYRGNRVPMRKLEIALSLLLETGLQILSGIVLLIWLQSGNFSFFAFMVVFLASTCLFLIIFRVSNKPLRNHINLDNKYLANMLIVWFLLILTWLISMPFFYFMVNGIFNMTERPLFFWVTIWKTWIVSSILSYLGSLLGGLGILRETSMVLLLKDSFGGVVSLAIAAASRIFLLVGNLFWAGVFLFLAKVAKKQNHIS